ncbi:hypothetical protein RGQ29_019279 [Quercus rubra]|uniref:non-specific serine/threonine protein kinase n=1 Tax=Quercus rubra TaxID=3512 RepID=A0AAN7FAD8_QUERU|nr:hypothetical protein RGQ29_019279 [Quercus rubra]
MGLVRNTSMSILVLLLCCFCLDSGSALDSITSFQPIKDSDNIISNGSDFKLGFFSVVNSTSRYLRIWYNKKSKPLKDSFGVLTISKDRNLVILDGQKEILWSSNVTNSVANLSAQLLDLGNLVLRESTTGTIVWESFQHPSDTLLQRMKFSTNVRTGDIEQRYWDYEKDDWGIPWNALKSECDVYGICGAFGSCNSQSSPICSCLPGKLTSGCVRRTPSSQCAVVNSSIEAIKMDGFLKLKTMKVPDFADSSPAHEDYCRLQCLENCSRIAYAYDSGTGCMSWTRSLIDIQKFSNGGVDLYIRVAHSELVKIQELPLFKVKKLAKATNNFHLSNKLGQGGFGPIYRGTLSDGQEVAIKRLSKASGQGLQEFMNEVVVISKLQHRNLVRLLGCYVEGEENLLVYEYMPNKSLDAFLFAPHKEKLLDWRKQFNIIEGISRGLLYLHRDSRLRIIHRDLKAGNILLDKELNPKILDFGMAKIFRNNENQANTNRKSDVFSFGVLLLEILSGSRNSSFYHDESMCLLGYAWKLWNVGNIVALIDPVISKPCFEMEILRCIHVGLLCVQEFAKDRPIVSVVISMLKSEIVDLPHPKQPAFTERQIALDTKSSQHTQIKCYVNNVTITMVQGR